MIRLASFLPLQPCYLKHKEKKEQWHYSKEHIVRPCCCVFFGPTAEACIPAAALLPATPAVSLCRRAEVHLW